MNPLDLEHLKAGHRELRRIAEFLEVFHQKNKGPRLSGLLRIVAEMHDHQARLTDIIEWNTPENEAEGSNRMPPHRKGLSDAQIHGVTARTFPPELHDPCAMPPHRRRATRRA